MLKTKRKVKTKREKTPKENNGNNIEGFKTEKAENKRK